MEESNNNNKFHDNFSSFSMEEPVVIEPSVLRAGFTAKLTWMIFLLAQYYQSFAFILSQWLYPIFLVRFLMITVYWDTISLYRSPAPLSTCKTWRDSLKILRLRAYPHKWSLLCCYVLLMGSTSLENINPYAALTSICLRTHNLSTMVELNCGTLW